MIGFLEGLPATALGSAPTWIMVVMGFWLLRYVTKRREQDGKRLTDLEKENRQLRADVDKCALEKDAMWRRIWALEALVPRP